MTLLRRLLLFDQPQETRFFAVLGIFGLVISVIYWFVSYEPAGTALLLAFGGATGLAALRLGLGRPRRVARGAQVEPADALAGEQRGEGSGGGTGGVDRPFADESGRLPTDTLAPLSLGLGIALALTGVVFGPWLVVAGLIPLAWGAFEWLSRASEELEAIEVTDERAERLAAAATAADAPPGSGGSARSSTSRASGPAHPRP